MDLQKQYDAAIAALAQQDEIKVTDLILAALGDAVGEVIDEQRLSLYLHRISVRQYPEGVFIIALDAKQKTDDHPGTFGRVLMGFSEAELKPVPGGGWKLVRQMYDARQALLFELNKRPLPPLPLDFFG